MSMEESIMDFKPSYSELENALGEGIAEAFVEGEYKLSYEQEKMAIARLMWSRGKRADSMRYLDKVSPEAKRGFLLAHGGF